MLTSRIGQWLLITGVVFGAIITPLIAKQLAAAAQFTGCGGEEVATANAAYETQVVDLVNQARAEQGLPPLKFNQALSNAARYHAMDMTQDVYFQHSTYDKVDGELTPVCVWYERVGIYYPMSSGAENIAQGYDSPTSVMAGWLASEGHRRNILSSNWEIGVGFHGNIWVQDFSRRRDYFPLIINREAATTNATAVALYLYGEWDEMRLRNDGGPWSEWQPFLNEVNWELNATPGERLVEAELRTPTRSSTTSDTITLLLETTATPSPSDTPTLDPARTTATPTPTPTFFVTSPPCSNCLDARVAFEGRPAPPHASWVTPIVVKLLALHEPNQPKLLTLPGETSPNGYFRLYDLTPGPYEIRVKGSHTLQRSVSLTVTADLTEVAIGLLSEGDVIADNHVDILDFSRLANVFESCRGADSYENAADLNADGCINHQDLNLLQNNFGLRGDEDAAVSAATVADSPPMVEVQNLQVGERFGVNIAVDSAVITPVDGGAFFVNFDPTLLQVVDIVINSQFAVELQNERDNSTGQVDVAAGILAGNVQPPFTFATLFFETKQPIIESLIVLDMAGERRTDLAANGISLLDQVDPSSVIHLSINQFTPTTAIYLPLVAR